MRGNLAEQLDGGAPTAAESSSTISSIAAALAVIATGSLGVALITRAIVVGRGPWGNLYEFTISFAFGICAAAIVFDRKRRLPALSTIAYGVALALLAYATTLPNAVVDLVPALQHPFLLTIHVGMAMLSYDRYSWLPPAKRLDLVAFRAVTVAFPLFAGMLILGSIWASIAWSRFWGWDPKETSALATWLIYAVYLHARSQRGWQGRPAALLLVIGFVAVLLTYSGNLWFTGLHTYSGL